MHLLHSHTLLAQHPSPSLNMVLVESPLSASTLLGLVRNKKYARACFRDCLSRGEAPYASHLLYAQEGVLNDSLPEERALGMLAGFIWGQQAKLTVVYTDLGISPGMQLGIERAQLEQRLVEIRQLGFVPSPTQKEIELELARQSIEEELLSSLIPIRFPPVQP